MGTPPIPSIPGLYNTGTGDDYEKLPMATQTYDPHYSGGSYTWFLRYDVLGNPLPTGWMPNPIGSDVQWISKSDVGNTPNGSYWTATMTFTLETLPDGATITGRLAADDYAQIVVNGGAPYSNFGDYDHWYSFTFDSGDLVKGDNEVKFLVTNSNASPSPVGLIVEWLSATAGQESPLPGPQGNTRPSDAGPNPAPDGSLSMPCLGGDCPCSCGYVSPQDYALPNQPRFVPGQPMSPYSLVNPGNSSMAVMAMAAIAANGIR